ncbi:diacylglycerol kinase-like protein [Nitrosospira sp. Nsp5]|uniref:Diacylglycerol kinase catalytic domain-containing protein n=1 Tax=Nitrosospira multiformis TaxID=1231 RepID=A0ABY0T8K6_9PROT|nr:MULTISPECIES: acylglycerol kinase family protein [Nitrosospira]PTR07319.1 diacylglycerol kinase-like protein [Nitrosospira sp. Nsp5]SDQ44231.1 Diacylglycerol kinase catalytic domain-containing protein [Nitrosospira multiformis]
MIGLLFNPLSGRIRKRKDAIRRVLAEIPGATCSEVTNEPEINASVDAFVRADVDLLVIIGGDGTVQGVLCHLFATQPLARWPALTIIPGGTTNMTALDLGICGKPEFILQQLKGDLLKQIPPVFLQRHVLCIEQAGVAKVYGMFFGVGLIARAVIFSQSKIKQLGITGEIYSGLITVVYLIGLIFGRRHGAWAPVRMSIIERNIELHHGTYAFLFASTLDRLLFGMRPYWGKEEEPLHITFVRQKPNRPLRSLLALLSGHGGSLKEQDGYHSCNTGALELLIDDDYIVDGESYRASSENGPLRITAAGPITFLGAGKVNSQS